jgi:mono/diheme cytochrome c family protein
MKNVLQLVLLLVALGSILALGCAKKTPSEGTTTVKALETGTAPEATGAEGKAAGTEGEIDIASKAPKDAQAVKNPIKADVASLERGKALYAKNCALCHGDKGDGKGPEAAGLTPPPADFTSKEEMGRTDGALFWVVSNGGYPMPDYSKTLTENERWDLVNYVRAFVKK